LIISFGHQATENPSGERRVFFPEAGPPELSLLLCVGPSYAVIGFFPEAGPPELRRVFFPEAGPPELRRVFFPEAGPPELGNRKPFG